MFLAFVVLSCGGGGGGGSDGPSYRCEDSEVTADTVALTCGLRTAKDVWSLQVVIGGRTSSFDINGFNFDVIFDPASLSYVTGSASVGEFLRQGGNSPLLAVEVASNDPGRLIVGIHRTNSSSGVGLGSGQSVVLDLSFRTNAMTAFDPVLLQFENAEAVDSNGNVVASVQFSDQLLLSVK